MAGETGTIREGIRVRTLKHAHTAALVRHEILKIQGNVTIGVNASAANADNTFVYRGTVELPKQAGVAVAPGEIVYWDDTNRYANKTSAGNTKCGICIEDVAAGGTVVIVALNEN
ncbi:DUF2190 family protein [bacterium]|nr:DUF2190 family protein [bacterium]